MKAAGLARALSGERAALGVAFTTLFGMSAAHALLETGRDALFLARLPASELPFTYLAIAAAAAAIARLPSPTARSAIARRALSALLLGGAGVTCLFWALGDPQSRWTLRALYVWTGVNATLTGLQLWYVIGDLWTVTQAKRAYARVALGGLLGTLAGAALARALATSGDASRLVLASAVVQASTALLPAMLLTSSAQARPRPRLALGAVSRLLRDEPYLRGVAALTLLSTLAFTAVDFVFKSSVASAVPPGQLGWFFATFYTFASLLALVAQLVVTGWIIRALGLPRAQQALPAVLLLAFGAVAAGGGVVAALVLKLLDGGLREAHRTTSELLLVPVPEAQRARARPFLDVVVRRGGQALASLGILALLALPQAVTWVAAGGAVLCLAWVVRTAALRQPYLDLFRVALRERRLTDASRLPPLDVGSLEALFTGLGSSDDAEVIAAMDVLAEQGRARLIPPLVLYHPSEEVVLRALELFGRAGRRDVAGGARHLLGQRSPRLRAAALQALSPSTPEEREILVAATRDASGSVRAAALVCLAAAGEAAPEADRRLEDLLRGPDPEAQITLARAIAHRPAAGLEGALLRLARSGDPEVLAAVAWAMGTLRDERFLPALLGLLAPADVRTAAREAFLAYGDRGLAFLEHALQDPALAHEIRRHVPRTISRFPPERAARILLARFLDEPDGMVRFKILRGLGRIVADHPRVLVDRERLRTAIDRTLEAAFRALHWCLVLERGALEDPRRATPVHGLLVALLRDKERQATDRLFRLLAIRLRGENLADVHRGLGSADPKLRASSRELLEHVLGRRLRSSILALVDEDPAAARVARAAPAYRAPPLGYHEVLALLLDAPGDTLRTLAVQHAAELRAVALRPRIARLRDERPTPFLARAAAAALRALPEEP